MGMVVVSAAHGQKLKKLCFGVGLGARGKLVSRVVPGADQRRRESLRTERGSQADRWFLGLSHAALSHEIMSK